MAFLPLDQTDAASEVFGFANARCTAPARLRSTCSLPWTRLASDGMYTSLIEGECYAADGDNLSIYEAPPAASEPTTGPVSDRILGRSPSRLGPFDAASSGRSGVRSAHGRPRGRSRAREHRRLREHSNCGGDRCRDGQRYFPDSSASSLLQDEDQDGDGWVFHITFTAVGDRVDGLGAHFVSEGDACDPRISTVPPKPEELRPAMPRTNAAVGVTSTENDMVEPDRTEYALADFAQQTASKSRMTALRSLCSPLLSQADTDHACQRGRER